MDVFSFLAGTAVGLVVGLALGLALWIAARARLTAKTNAAAEMRDAFDALAADALRRNSQSFLDLAHTKLGEFQTLAGADLDARRKAIDETLRPIHESLARIDAQMQAVEKQRASVHGMLTQQIETLALGQRTLQTETGRLVQALRSPNVRGNWGEMTLRRVVDAAGMLAHCDFDEKPSATTPDGQRRTPDLIVHLPGGRQIIVDAKVPIEAFLKAVDATDDRVRETHLVEHARQVKTHMDGLGRKAYWDQFQPAPEFVFMFLPSESLLGAALQHDPTLLEFGVKSRVIPATPLTLIALLRAVAYGWQQERLAENAEEMERLGRELYERIGVVAKHFGAVGRNLREAMEAYNRAVGSAETRLLVTARKFKEVGAGTTEELPDLEPVDVVPRQFQAPELAEARAPDDDPARE